LRSVLSSGRLPKIQLIGEVDNDGCREEVAWIKYFRDEGVSLVNETEGGEGSVGWKASEEQRKKNSVRNKGRKLSEETREKMSRSRMGHVVSIETRSKISRAHTGMASPLKGKPGRKHSAETRLKLSESHKGSACSGEQRRKLCESQKRYWESPKSNRHREKIGILMKKMRERAQRVAGSAGAAPAVPAEAVPTGG